MTSYDDVTTVGEQSKSSARPTSGKQVDETDTNKTQLTADISGESEDINFDERANRSSMTSPSQLNYDEILASSHSDGSIRIWSIEVD